MRGLVFISLSISISLILPIIAQPLRLGLIIIISTLFLCFIRAIILSPWYGYILFLIYVGGLLVIFAYVSALSPNTLFSRFTPILYLFFIISVWILIFIYQPIIDSNILLFLNNYVESKNIKILGSEIVSPHIISVLLGLGLILLVNLIAVVKICYYQYATIRPFNENY